jgi:2,5-diketo-D-gluconate reductase A
MFTSVMRHPEAKAINDALDLFEILMATQRGVVVIPKSSRPERTAENIAVFDFELTGDEMDRIAALDTGASIVFDHRDPQTVSAVGGYGVD